MIQRKQSLLLLSIALFSTLLLFLPYAEVIINGKIFEMPLIPTGEIETNTAFSIAIALNFLVLILSFATIFLYKKRELQIKLCYVICVACLALLGLTIFVPFIELKEGIQITKGFITTALLGVMFIDSFIATIFIKKDIELLKSADRIR
jgi:hypothetical protein